MARTRKQKEIERREEMILETAREMLLKEGYVAMTMDRIAEAVDYSKGTVYQHFSCKEDILAELTVQAARRRTDLFEKAATFQGCPRERMTALGVATEVFIQSYPDHFQSEQLILNSSLWCKTSSKRREQVHACISRILSIMSGIIRDAVSQGDLTIPKHTKVDEISFGLWGITVGCHSIMMTPDLNLLSFGIDDPFAALRRNCNYLLDGLGWKPLFREADYKETYQRIYQEVFPHVIRQQTATKPIEAS
ncbi:MAG TPA: TetR/AcrR family transcriptional regulator [Acidobacteriota bacterium]|nr:TetR/AcrR family transcriptional regulator [Acidobacteriota bacterium]